MTEKNSYPVNKAMWNTLTGHLSPSIPARQFRFVSLPRSQNGTHSIQETWIWNCLFTDTYLIQALKDDYCISASSNPTVVGQRCSGTLYLNWFVSVPLNITKVLTYSEIFWKCSIQVRFFAPYSSLDNSVIHWNLYSPALPAPIWHD